MRFEVSECGSLLPLSFPRACSRDWSFYIFPRACSREFERKHNS